jgi:hypothetical protein
MSTVDVRRVEHSTAAGDDVRFEASPADTAVCDSQHNHWQRIDGWWVARAGRPLTAGADLIYVTRREEMSA